MCGRTKTSEVSSRGLEALGFIGFRESRGCTRHTEFWGYVWGLHGISIYSGIPK